MPATVHGAELPVAVHRIELPTGVHRTELTATVLVAELGGVELGRRLEPGGPQLVSPASELDAGSYYRMNPGVSQFSTLPQVIEVATPLSGSRNFSNVAIEQEISRLDQEIAEQERLQALKDQRALLAAQLRENRD